MLVAAPVVSAQNAGGDQYNPGGTGPAGGSGQGPGGEAGTGGGPSAGVGETGGGALPFTGYPLTPLVLAVILLVVLGLAFRLWSQARPRLGPAETTTS